MHIVVNSLLFFMFEKNSFSFRSINLFACVSLIQLFDFVFRVCKGIVHKDE